MGAASEGGGGGGGGAPLGRQLWEVRQRIASSKRRLHEEEQELSEMRRKVQRLKKELSAEEQQEAELIAALGGEEAAEAAAQAVVAAVPAAAPYAQQSQPPQQQYAYMAAQEHPQQAEHMVQQPQQHMYAVQHMQQHMQQQQQQHMMPAQQQQQQQQHVQQQEQHMQQLQQQHMMPAGSLPGVQPGAQMIVQHLPPPHAPHHQQPAVVVFNSQQGYMAMQEPQQMPGQGQGYHQQPQQQMAGQQQYYMPHPYYQHPAHPHQQLEQVAMQHPQPPQQQPAGPAAPSPPPLPVQPQLAGTGLAPPALAVGAAAPAARPRARGTPPGFAALDGPAAAGPGRSPSPSLSPEGSGVLTHTSQEFVPRAVQLQGGGQQAGQKAQPAAAAPAAAPAAALPMPAGGAGQAAGQAAGSSAPPGFEAPSLRPDQPKAAVPAQADQPKAPAPSPLAAFPMPGRPAHPPPQPPAQQAQQAEPAHPVRQNGGAAATAAAAEPAQQAQRAGAQRGQQAQAQAPAWPLVPGTENDAALAAALANASESDDEDLSTAMRAAGLGGRPGGAAPAAAPQRSWGRGRGGGSGGPGRPAARAAQAPGSPPEGPTSAEGQEGQAEQAFPSLAAAGAPSGGAGRGAPGWGNAWSTQTLRNKLAASTPPPLLHAPAQQAQQRAQAPAGGAGVEEAEARSGLRVPGDQTPDAERRRVVRKQVFEHMEKHMRSRQPVNVVEGLELHCNVLSAAEQEAVVDAVEHWVAQGKTGHLRGRTFSAPKKWLPGKGRVTMQFGCCYNYARDTQGRDPGIIPEEVVEPMPPLLVALCRRLTRWGVLPRGKEPNSAIVNIYERGDCIPPHVDHHDFTRPFCTLSFLSEECIMFGQRLVPAGPGQFEAQGGSPIHIPLPTGSCLVLKGHGGDQAMHCVPPVAARRISITLRKIGAAHEPAVFREVKRLEQEQGAPLQGFWEASAGGHEHGYGRQRGAITIK